MTRWDTVKNDSRVTSRVAALLAGVLVLPLAGCQSKSAQPSNTAPPAVSQEEAAPAEEIAPDDPIWDLVAKKQAHLDRVEQHRVGNDSARSCQRAVPGPHQRVKVDTSGCTAEQLRSENDAERSQLFEQASHLLDHRK